MSYRKGPKDNSPWGSQHERQMSNLINYLTTPIAHLRQLGRSIFYAVARLIAKLEVVLPHTAGLARELFLLTDRRLKVRPPKH